MQNLTTTFTYRTAISPFTHNKNHGVLTFKVESEQRPIQPREIATISFAIKRISSKFLYKYEDSTNE